MANCTIVRGDRDLGEWQEFASTQAPGNMMLDAAWYRILGEAFSVERYFLMCRDASGRVVGLAPLYFSRSTFAGTHLASLDDGWLARDAETAASLLKEAIALRDSLGASYLLLRGATDISNCAQRVVSYVHRDIDTGQPIDNLLREIRKKSRLRYIRRASEIGFSVEQDRELARIDVFYELYARHMRDLGTPVMSIAYMRALKRHFGPARLRLFFLSRAGREIGGMLCVASTGCWLDLYAVVETDLLPLYPNYLLYWRVIEAAVAAGVTKFDLGRSPPNSGAHAFKSKWPGRDRFVPHCYFGATSVPARLDRIREQDSPMQRAWKLMPLPLANWLGPKLRDQLPFG